MSLFERYLSIWVAICIFIGVILGNLLPNIFSFIAELELAHVNLVVAVFIWIMIYPMMVQVNFSAITEIRNKPKGLLLTLVVNWMVKPFTMAALGWLFFKVLFVNWVDPQSASEYHVLSDDERDLISKRAIDISNEQIPIVIGVTGISTNHSINLALRAEEIGADAVIAMPPHGHPPTREEATKFFEDLGSSLSIPVFIQNHSFAFGMDSKTLIEVMKNAPNVDYLKEETFYGGQVSTQVLENAGNACKGIMGGNSGRWMPAEFNRGQCGNMPSAHMCDVLALIWNKLESGDLDGGRNDHNRLLSLISFENIYGIEAFKEVLVRRGVIESATVRSPGKHAMDRYDLIELEKLMSDIPDLLRWHV